MAIEQSTGLRGFLELVEHQVDEAISNGNFDASQRALLLASAAQHRPRTHRNPLGDPLAVFYLIARAHRDELDEQALELATFCSFYLLALDLLDDVQDHDLSGKPHAAVGAGMAVNDALTLLFLGLSALERTMRLEKSPARRMSYLRLVNRVALTTGRGQHLDLMGESGARTPGEVLQMQREKTASLSLVCECAALYAGASDDEREHYRVLGENLSLLVQVLDDVRDVYGKARSPDLETNKMSYPRACFLARAGEAEREHFQDLKERLPSSLPEIRALFYRSGALEQAARSMERFRRAIHREIAAFDEEAPTHRLLLFVVDRLVTGVYAPKPVAETSALLAPRFGWHAHVQGLARDLAKRLAPFGVPGTPPLVPWHEPQWTYDKQHGVIYYPDIEGLPEETLPFQAALLGEPDLKRVARLMWRQAPAVMAHELFHHYRDAVGQLGSDMWLEELVANRLALAYCARYEPEAVAGGVEIAERVLALPEHRLVPEAERILAELLDPARAAQPDTGYGLSLHQTALVQLAMIRELAKQPEELAALMHDLLGARVAA
jgi:geranylgeranyl pyrophosphate synthase